jgi:hypothetical protein
MGLVLDVLSQIEAEEEEPKLREAIGGMTPAPVPERAARESRVEPIVAERGTKPRGLIQFMPETAKGMGYADADDLVEKHPTVEAQLQGPVKDYLAALGPFKDEGDFYLSVFHPASRNKNRNQSFPANVLEANSKEIRPGVRVPIYKTPSDLVKKYSAQPTGLNSLTPEQLDSANQVAAELGVPVEWLGKVVMQESGWIPDRAGGTILSKRKKSGSGMASDSDAPMSLESAVADLPGLASLMGMPVEQQEDDTMAAVADLPGLQSFIEAGSAAQAADTGLPDLVALQGEEQAPAPFISEDHRTVFPGRTAAIERGAGGVAKGIAAVGDAATLIPRRIMATASGLGTLAGGGTQAEADAAALAEMRAGAKATLPGEIKWSDPSTYAGAGPNFLEAIARDPSTYIPASKLAKGAKLGKAALFAAKEGAKQGAASAAYQGAVEGDVDAGRVATQIGFGAALGVAGEGLGALAGKAMGRFGKKIDPAAAQKTGQVADEIGLTPDEVTNLQSRFQQMAEAPDNAPLSMKQATAGLNGRETAVMNTLYVEANDAPVQLMKAGGKADDAATAGAREADVVSAGKIAGDERGPGRPTTDQDVPVPKTEPEDWDAIDRQLDDVTDEQWSAYDQENLITQEQYKQDEDVKYYEKDASDKGQDLATATTSVERELNAPTLANAEEIARYKADLKEELIGKSKKDLSDSMEELEKNNPAWAKKVKAMANGINTDKTKWNLARKNGLVDTDWQESWTSGINEAAIKPEEILQFAREGDSKANVNEQFGRKQSGKIVTQTTDMFAGDAKFAPREKTIADLIAEKQKADAEAAAMRKLNAKGEDPLAGLPMSKGEQEVAATEQASLFSPRPGKPVDNPEDFPFSQPRKETGNAGAVRIGPGTPTEAIDYGPAGKPEKWTARTAKNLKRDLAALFTFEGQVPAPGVMKLKEQADNAITAATYKVSRAAHDWDVQVKKIPGMSKQAVSDLRFKVDQVLKGEVDISEIPQNLRGPVRNVVLGVRKMAKESVEAGIATGDLAARMSDEGHFYITRAYLQNKVPDWAQVARREKPELWNRVHNLIESETKGLADKRIETLMGRAEKVGGATAALQNQAMEPMDEFSRNALGQKIERADWMLEKISSDMSTVRKNLEYDLTPERLEGAMNKLLTSSEVKNAVTAAGKLGSKPMNIFKKRSQWLTDHPEVRALKGEIKDPTINAIQTYQNMSTVLANHNMLEQVRSLGEGKWLTAADKGPLGNNYVPIAAEGSASMAPLNGMYTTPEIAKAFSEFGKSQKGGGWFGNLWMRSNASVKLGKTVLNSPGTYARNALMWPHVMTRNGHFDYSGAVDAFKSLALDDKNLREFQEELISLGVTGQSVRGNITRELLDDLKRNLSDAPFAQAWGKITAPVAAVGNKLKSAYSGTDDLGKTIYFIAEKNKLVKAGFEEAEAKLIAAENTKLSTPTYSRIPKKLRDAFRVLPFGDFMSFRYERLRNNVNMIKMIGKELADPRRKAIGTQRAVGMLASTAVPIALGVGSAGVYGWSKEKIAAARAMAPPWTKDSPWFYGKDNTYIPLDQTDPDAVFTSGIIALINGKSVEEAALIAAQEAFEPFYAPGILPVALGEVAFNTKMRGKTRIWEERDTPEEIATKITEHLVTKAGPGAIAWTARTVRAATGEPNKYGDVNTLENELWSNLGYRVNSVKPEVSLKFKLVELAAQERQLPLRDREIAGEKEKVSAIYSDMWNMAYHAQVLGMSPNEIAGAFKAAKIGEEKAKAIMSGNYEAFAAGETESQIRQLKKEKKQREQND